MDLKIHSPLPQRRDFRIGILGSGFIVNDCHLVAYRKAGFNPVAIASRTRARTEEVAKRHAIPHVYDNYEQLLDDPSIEVLDIAVPPNAQLALIKAACQRKTVKGILAQKPLGMNYAEALEAVCACEAAGITLAVNQNMRYDQSVRAAKTLLENGTIGEPVLATIDMRGIPHWMPWQAELGWVTLRIMSIHHLDTFRYWFGDPEGIYCSTRTDPRTKFPHSDGIATYIMEYKNGLRCVGIDDTWTGPAKEGCPEDIRIQWRIEGTNGLAIGDIGWCKDPYTTPSMIRYAAKGDKEFHRPQWSESWFPDGFIGTMAQLLIALERGEAPAISGKDNLKTMALVDAAYRSTETFRSVAVDEIEGEASPPENQPPSKKKESAGVIGSLLKKFLPTAESDYPNFTPRAQQVLALARKEADRFNHNFVGTEHVLLGIIRLKQGVAVNVLRRQGVDLERARTEIEKQVGTGPDEKQVGNIPYTPRVRKVLKLAAAEAKALNHTYVGTEHILLGLLLEGDGVAARILKNLDMDIEETRNEILKELDPDFRAESTRSKSVRISLPPQKESQMSNFTPRAQQVLALARKEADQFKHNYVGAEHLLLGLIKLGSGVANNVLLNHRLTLESVRCEVESHLGRDTAGKPTANIPYTPEVNRVLAQACMEARALNHIFVGTEHILLGLLDRERLGVAQIFKNLGADAEKMRQEILRELAPGHTDEETDKPDTLLKFNRLAQELMALSVLEAARCKSRNVEAEHLFIGLLQLNHGVVSRILDHRVPDRSALVANVQTRLATGDAADFTERYDYSTTARSIFNLAELEVKTMGDKEIGPEHILLGFLVEKEGLVYRTLQELGFELVTTRSEIIKLRGKS